MKQKGGSDSYVECDFGPDKKSVTVLYDIVRVDVAQTLIGKPKTQVFKVSFYVLA